MRRSRAWLTLALALMLVACLPSGRTSPLPPTAANDCTEPSVITLDSGWLFRTDPDDVGLSQQWYASSPDSGDWRSLAPGEPWESSGLIYDGVAWYHTIITVPAWSEVYLGFGRVDDVATLWLNGKRELSWEARDSESEAQAFDITDISEPSDRITVTVRIEDLGGYGGIKGPVSLSDEPRGVMEEGEYIWWLFETHTDWPMPGWLRGAPLAWTMTGRPEAGVGAEVLVRSDGAVAPWATAPTAELWLFDPASGQLATGTGQTTSFSLHQGHLPIPTWEWAALGARVESTLYSDIGEPAVEWQVSVVNTEAATRNLLLLLVVRPFAINRSLAPICSVGVENDSRLWINGSPFLVAGTTPASAGVAPLDAVMDAALQGEAPVGETSSSQESGLGAATLTYPLSLAEGQSETLQFALLPASSAGADHQQYPTIKRGSLSDTAVAWEDTLNRVQIDVPDELVEGGVRASTGYLLLSIDPNGPHPGPLTHDAMWVRDAAYIGLALLQLGHGDAVRDYIPQIFAAQEPNGRVPPIQGEKIPWDDEEWDAQGQAIFLATSYYRYTGEKASLEKWYPALRAAAKFIVDLRLADSQGDGPAQGLLPPSKSAEDLGPPDQHYYWDNLWAVAGLEEAAYAAGELGKPEDAAWMKAEAEALRDAVLRSVEHVMGPEPAYIPGAVEDVESSAMARGTVPALWPVQVFSPDSPLIARSFDTYHKRWIAPDSGGFRHRQDQFWPYGGLELAHAYLRLGRKDVLHEILGWSLEHQTLDGTYAWAEQVDPETGGFSGGDMPHAWAAASYATLVREMLVSEREDHVVLFSGVPGWWFEDDRTITMVDAPTHFGPLNLHTEGSVQNADGVWEGVLRLTLSGAEPLQGFRWELPNDVHSVEGPPGVTVEDGWLTVPSGGGTVRLVFSSPE